MMVTFISQCEKKALKKTRRVLDAFANRIGDNTWQTVITKEGLDATHKLLRKTATKNTAVSCHWIRTRARSDLLWVVGKRHEFNEMGYVPVNRTQRNILHNEWQNNWKNIPSIQIVSTLAALLHDIGKSTIGFQKKLKGIGAKSDPYRHEWLSLKLFEWLINGCVTDQAWLERLVNLKAYLSDSAVQTEMIDFIKTNKEKAAINNMPPVAQWVAWLIVTHHRLPPFDKVFYNNSAAEKLKKRGKFYNANMTSFYKRIFAVEYWVKNPKLFSGKKKLSTKQQDDFWGFDQLVIHSQIWQQAIKRWSIKALNDSNLLTMHHGKTSDSRFIDDPMIIHLSRLCLMVGDHNYSSLNPKDNKRVKGDKNFESIAANTDRKTKQIKQSLDEHLLGVSKFTSKFARVIPIIAQDLPVLKNQNSLSEDTKLTRFAWQNKAAKLSRALQNDSDEHGFFGVNMASTGCGKTIGNARIMYALSEKSGARFTVALGLRVLTLQTGDSFRKDLGLNDSQLAILVGGQAQRELNEINADDSDNQPENDKISESDIKAEANDVLGSESASDYFDNFVDADIDFNQYKNLNLDTVIENNNAKNLIFSPIVSCTVDHLIQATECKRGGIYIAPMLRLLSSDLILDEPDDFNESDLPALSRLVHMAGVMGSRLLLSSATLTPDLMTGLFRAYQAGRIIHNKNLAKKPPMVVCAWFDERETGASSTACKDAEAFQSAHKKFTAERAHYLKQQKTRRKAHILQLQLESSAEHQAQFFSELAQQLMKSSINLHDTYHIKNKVNGLNKKISIGLIRVAHVKNIVKIAQAINKLSNINNNYQVHLACYHSKQVLILRNATENKLDRILKRSANKPEALFNHPEIKSAIKGSELENHMFIVLASPVAEVGRDHDYDWAIVEPSSSRSIIQLAGRVWRHRPEKEVTESNIHIMQFNIKGLHKKPIAFNMPGYETKEFPLCSHDMNDLITQDELNHINAVPRIIKPEELNPFEKLSHLEHAVMNDSVNSSDENYINSYWRPQSNPNRLHTHLQNITPFRAGNKQDDWILIPNETGFDVFAAEQVRKNKLNGSTKHNNTIIKKEIHFTNEQVKPWLITDLKSELDQLKHRYPNKNINFLATKFSVVSLDAQDSVFGSVHGWYFNEWLGFWKID